MPPLDWKALLVILSFVLLLTHKFWLPSLLELLQGRTIFWANKRFGVSVREDEARASGAALISSQISSTSYPVSVVNASSLSDEEVGAATRALQIQIRRDLAPAWGVDAELVLVPRGAGPTTGSWALVVGDESDQPGFISYHTLTDEGLPMAKVFVRTAAENDLLWTFTASHELLEMLADSGSNLTVFRQADEKTGRLYKRQICDPCRATGYGYLIDGILVSDFVCPAWFQELRSSDHVLFDQCGHITAPFMILPGCDSSVFDVKSGSGWRTVTSAAASSKSKGQIGP